MGLIFSRFRKKKTTIEILEGIDKEINGLQKNRKENQDRQKQVVTSLIIYSIILYILSAIVFFLLYFPDTWPLRLLYSLPLLAFPFLIWGMKKLLHWYFVKRIAGNDLALRDLREKKKQILEDVMETETYKKAKEILEKFDPARFKKLERDEQTSPISQASTLSPPGTALHQRKNIVSQPSTPMPRGATSSPISRLPAPRPAMSSASPVPNPFLNTPLRAPGPSQSRTPAPMSVGRGRGGVGGGPIQPQQMMQAQAMPLQMARGPPGPPMPRSVLPRDRGMMDKMMDYLVGDGPENRYALICRACHSHNGMALKEEFEYMSFRCCYCFVMNPARKQRPLAPRLEFFTPNAKTVTLTKPEESDDDDEEDSSEDESGKMKEDVADKTSKEILSSNKDNDNKVTPSSFASAASTSSVQTPISSKSKNTQSKSKLPIAGGATSTTNIKASVSQGPKNNVPSSSLSENPASSPDSSVWGSSDGFSGKKDSETPTGDDKLSKSSVPVTSIQATKSEKFENEEVVSNEYERNNDIQEQERMEIAGGIDIAEPLQPEECDDEYEMITAADGEDSEGLVSSSSHDNKTLTSSEVGKEEEGTSA